MSDDLTQLIEAARNSTPDAAHAIAQLRRQTQQLSYEASHDALTGLLNRRELERRLQAVFENAAIDRSQLAVVMIDLDGFKKVNDRFGHTAGDDLLRHVGSLLRRAARADDLIARFGGDEFIIVLENCSEEDTRRVTNNVLELLKTEECRWAHHPLQVRGSVGVAVGSGQDASWLTLLERADLACYDAKAHGGQQVRVFRDDCTVNLRVSRTRQFAMRIEHALANEELQLLAQRIAPVRERRSLSHYEILVRGPEINGHAEVLDPSLFTTEQPSLAHRLDRWCIRKGFDWVAGHHHANPAIERWFVNITRVSLEDPQLGKFIATTLQDSGAPANRLGIEIEEEALGTCFHQVSELTQELKPLGLEFTLDGFGRGLSSFTYLKSLDVTHVKIDQAALVHGADDDASEALLHALHQINRVLGKRTIIQSVTSEQMLRQVVATGVDYAQGSALATPVPLQDKRMRIRSA